MTTTNKPLETSVRAAALLAELDVAMSTLPAPKGYVGKHRKGGQRG